MSTTIRKALVSVSALALSAGAAQAFTLDILHINDMHSRIEPINAYDSTCSVDDDAAGECFGGVARLKTMADERREAISGEGGSVLMLDAGDQFQGSLFYTTYKGEAAAEFMNMIGFDAMAIGNHEFDDGPETLAAFIEKVDVPLISGNTVAAGGSPLEGAYEPYIIKEFGEERVAILSVIATDTDELSSPGEDITFEDEIEYLTGAVEEIETAGVDKIILLSHVGYVRDQEIAAAVEGIDAIVGGHSHTPLGEMEGAAGPYPTMVENPAGVAVPVVSTSGYSKYLGELSLEFDDAGVVISATGAPHLLDASVEQNEEVSARVAELRAPIEELMSEYVADTTGPIDGSRETCRQAECEMGNLVTDAMLAHTADQGIQIVITNGGGLRASIDEGEITMGEVIAVLPFQNTLATFELTGAGIVEALENSVSQYEEQGGRFAQVAGMRYTFDPAQPAGSRIVSVEIADGSGGFAPIDEAATYLVASNNFMRAGGDGYAVFETDGENAYDYGPGLELVIADYLRENTPYEPYLDGRIVNAAASGEAAAGAATEEEPAATTEPAEEEADAAGTEMETTGTDDAAPAEDAATEAPAEDAASEAPAADGADAGTDASGGAETAAPVEAAPTEDDAAAAEDVTEGEESTAAPIEPAAPAEDDAAMGEDAMSDDTATEEETAADPITPAPAEEESAADPITPAPTEEESAADPIEAAPAEAMAEDGARQHSVARGDTYWDIAEEYYGDGEMWQTIAEANPQMPERDLEVGATLTIPAQ